jgi:hypothetical protein
MSPRRQFHVQNAMYIACVLDDVRVPCNISS